MTMRWLRWCATLAMLTQLLASAGSVGAQAQGADDLSVINEKIVRLSKQGNFAQATELAQRALVLAEHQYGPDSLKIEETLSNLARLYRLQARYVEAEPLYKRSVVIIERAYGPNHAAVGVSLNNLALLYQDQGRLAMAEPLLLRALDIYRSTLGEDHPEFATSQNNLAFLYATQGQGRMAEAEPLYKRSLAIRERLLGPEHLDVAASLNNLAELYRLFGRYAEAEPLYKRSLAIKEKRLPPDHPDLGLALNNLALLYDAQGRYSEAEALYKRAITIEESAWGSAHPHLVRSFDNLALLYTKQRRFEEAAPLYERSLALMESAFGRDSPSIAMVLNNLAGFYAEQGRYSDAEPLHERALRIYEKEFGPTNFYVSMALNNLASVYLGQGRYADASTNYKRALSIDEDLLGPDHPSVRAELSNLAGLHFLQREWGLAADYYRRSTSIIVRRTQRGADVLGQTLTGKMKSEAELSSWQFRQLVKAVHHLASGGRVADATLPREMFQVAQWAQSSEAAQSLAQMAARGTKGNPGLAILVREREDLVGEWQKREMVGNAAVSQTPAKRDRVSEAANMARLTALDTRIAEIDRRLKIEFPNYAALTRPEPLSVVEVQADLRADETLVLFLETPEVGPTPEETFIWVITKTDMRWVRSELGSPALTREVSAVRCGLDSSSWEVDGGAKCAGLLMVAAPIGNAPLPFDLARAHDLYQALFGQVADLLKGKHLLIVPSGPLTQLPFHVLVTEQPDPSLTGTDALRRAAWLAKSNAITVLPAVSSLKALREHAKASQATKALIGFGNPLLDGRDYRDGLRVELSRARQQCRQTPLPRMAQLIGRGMNPPRQRGGLADLAEITHTDPTT